MSWKPEYVILIILSTLVDYYAAKKMSSLKKKAERKKWLYLSLTSNLGTLFFFKYVNFFSDNFNALLEPYSITIPYSNFLLPVGISFYTFQTLAYTIDVYNNKIKAQTHLGKFALYVSFFPQLVAGPIERAQHLLPQFDKKFDFDYSRVTSGLRKMLWGFFKKIVVADRLAIYVNYVFNDVETYKGFPLIWATLFFAFQIYCDFSAYSDIAIGAAKVMGFDLMENFKSPYLSKSIKEFWSRWHISLSTWFRDYLYIPLGGNKTTTYRWYVNLMVVFVVSGFWHGANWTFIIWGFLHSFYLIFPLILKNNMIIQKYTSNKFFKRTPFEIVITFFLISVAWIFFRANNIEDAIYIIKNSFAIRTGGVIGIPTFSKVDFILCFMAIFSIFSFEIVNEYFLKNKTYSSLLKKTALYLSSFLLIILIYLFGVFEKQEFIYFQF